MGTVAHLLIERDWGDPRTGRELFAGWIALSRPLVHAVLELPRGGGYVPVYLGYPREDVEREAPHAIAAGTSGFLIETPEGIGVISRIGRLWMCVGSNTGSNAWYVRSINLSAGPRQSWSLQALHRAVAVPAAVRKAAPRSSDIEAKFLSSLYAAPGLTLRLDLINKCNLRCIMCHYSNDAVFRRPARALSLEEFRKMFHTLGPLVRDVLLSCSDEPLMSKHFAEVLQFLATEHPKVQIKFCTNAMLLNAPARRAILSSGVDRILLSIDGVTKDVFESIRVGSKFERVIGNVKALRDLKRAHGATSPKMVVDFVMMRRNLHHAPAMVRCAKELGAEAIDFRHVVPEDGSLDMSNELLEREPARFNHYRREVLAEAQRHGIDIYITRELPTNAHWSPGPNDPPPPSEEISSVPSDAAAAELTAPISVRTAFKPSSAPTVDKLFARTFCPRPFSEVMIRNQEDILPCSWLAHPVGHLSETPDLLSVLRGSRFQELRRNMFKPEGDPCCRNCPIKGALLPTQLLPFDGPGVDVDPVKPNGT